MAGEIVTYSSRIFGISAASSCTMNKRKVSNISSLMEEIATFFNV